MSTRRIKISSHAVERFRERVRPALSLEAAGAELRRLVRLGEVAGEAPAWLAYKMRTEAKAYLVVGDLVLPLAECEQGGWVTKTCIPRGGISDPARSDRNRLRATRGRRVKRRRVRHGARRARAAA